MTPSRWAKRADQFRRRAAAHSGGLYGGVERRAKRIFSFNSSIVNESPSERIDYTFYIRKVVDQEIRLVFCKLLETPCAGCDGDSACAERFAAGNIARRVADHVDLGCGKLAAMLFLCARTSERPEPVTVPMIVRKGAELKKVPNAIVFELELRSARDIPSEKRDYEVRPRLQFLKQRLAEDLASAVPVVMITTEGSKPLVLGAIAAGARGYICKPFTPDQVKARVLPLLPAA